jgi:hypothetical protein
MDADAARAALTAALADAPAGDPANSVLVGEDIETAAVLGFDVTSAMAAQIGTDVFTTARSLTRRQFLPYDPSYQTSPSQVLVEELAGIPALAGMDATIRNGDVGTYAGQEPVLAMAHALGGPDGGLVAYRMKGAGIATRRARWVQLVPREGVYEPIRGEVLYYEPRFDVFTCAGFAYFTTATLIQSKLHAEEKARALARETLATVTAKVAIAGIGELEQAVMDDPTLRAKLAAIARLVETDKDYARHLTTKRLIRFAQDNPDYDILITQLDGKPALQFDRSPQHRHQIPKLLADDYLHSRLTERNYEAGSKHRIRR